MLFNSIHFLLFFPIVCALYFCLPSVRTRNTLLLIASYYFYMNWEPVYALLLLGSTTITFLAGIGIGRSQSRHKKKAYLTASIILNLGMLFLYKYFNFAAENLEAGMKLLSINMDIPTFPYLLPVGISFYVFQALGYSIDVYRGDTSTEKNFFTYALFVSFFPQLVAGPIERSSNLLPQFKKFQPFSYQNVMSGFKLMVWGYFLKLVLADRCGLYVDAIFNHTAQHNGGSYFLAAIFFPFQIYGDFCGYSLTAIGAAKVMGFRLMENFRRPYLATTVTDFWRRWHISLSTWFKDYVYIPLGGNRVGKTRNYFNILFTFLVSGIWHGANWTFIVWGGIHGVLQCIEKGLGWNRQSQSWKGFTKLFHWFMTFCVVSLAWIFFRANNLHEAATIIMGIFTNPGMPYLMLANFFAIAMALFIVFLKEGSEEFGWKLKIFHSKNWWIEHISIALAIVYIILFGVLNGDQFIYFQF